MRLGFGLAAAAALLIAGQANATTFVTTNSTATSVPGGYSFTADGITLTITAGLFEDNAYGLVYPGYNNARPYAYEPGLGIWHSGDREHTVDGNNGNEVLIFTFDTDVVIDSIKFSYFDRYDDFDFFFDSDDNGNLNRVLNDIDIPNSGLAVMASLFTGSGRWFGVGADGSDDSFKLRAITVSAVPQVPLPAAFPLFAAGMGAVGFASRRRKAKNAA